MGGAPAPAKMMLLLLIICSLYNLLINSTQAQTTTTAEVNVTLIEGAVSKGAVCLDGSPPGYAMAAGSGCGTKNWLIYMEGGGWCYRAQDCDYRAKHLEIGSSLRRTKLNFSGILDRNQTFNPDFYNWNRVYLIYCDGSSFLGDVEEVDPHTKIFYRGSRVFESVMEELLAKGMDTADNVILSGGSAGGLATILHCDNFRALLPHARRVKCISDSGFFINAKNMPGAMYREDHFYKAIKLHGMERFLPESCTSKTPNLSLCLFPENLIDDIQTPLFLLESSFDSYQLPEMITPYIGGGRTEWHKCLFENLKHCNSTQLKYMEEFRTILIETLLHCNYSPSRGTFVHSCYSHGHLTNAQTWKCSSLINNVLGNKTIADAIGDWYFDRSPFQHIDFYNKVPRNCTSALSPDAFMKQCARLSVM